MKTDKRRGYKPDISKRMKEMWAKRKAALALDGIGYKIGVEHGYPNIDCAPSSDINKSTMTDTDNTNDRLDEMEAKVGEVGGLGISDAKNLIAALRIAVNGLEAIGQQSGGRRVDPMLHAIAETLEGKP
jgi:hypothetical protein